MKILSFVVAAVILSISLPALEILRSNPSLTTLYGFSEENFWHFQGLFLLFPIFLFFLISRWNQKGVTLFLFLLFVHSIHWCLSLGFIVLFIFFRKKYFFSKLHSLLIENALILLILSLGAYSYRNYHFFKDSFGTDETTVVQIHKAEVDPRQNIFFILLDGSDITSSYLDAEQLPRQELLPHLHDYLKKDFQWFPNARSNSPQTYLSLPQMYTGFLDYQKAKEKMNSEQSLFSYAQQMGWDVKGMFYRSYYDGFCQKSRGVCSAAKTAGNANKVLFELYLNKIFLGLSPMSFLTGEKFQPPAADYEFDDYLKLIKPEAKNAFYYAHLFRRGIDGIINFDKEFKRLVDHLTLLGLYENSIIVITSDHGDDYTQHNHTYGTYARSTSRIYRIPFAIKLANQGEGKIIQKKVQSIDLTPTLIHLLGMSQIGKFDGLDVFKTSEETFSKRHHWYICNADKSLNDTFLNPEKCQEKKK